MVRLHTVHIHVVKVAFIQNVRRSAGVSLRDVYILTEALVTVIYGGPFFLLPSVYNCI